MLFVSWFINRLGCSCSHFLNKLFKNTFVVSFSYFIISTGKRTISDPSDRSDDESSGVFKKPSSVRFFHSMPVDKNNFRKDP